MLTQYNNTMTGTATDGEEQSLQQPPLRPLFSNILCSSFHMQPPSLEQPLQQPHYLLFNKNKNRYSLILTQYKNTMTATASDGEEQSRQKPPLRPLVSSSLCSSLQMQPTPLDQSPQQPHYLLFNKNKNRLLYIKVKNRYSLMLTQYKNTMTATASDGEEQSLQQPPLRPLVPSSLCSSLQTQPTPLEQSPQQTHYLLFNKNKNRLLYIKVKNRYSLMLTQYKKTMTRTPSDGEEQSLQQPL
jgi:hypothetical protein